MRLGGGGETTRFVCGYFGCERHADKLFLAGLPLIKINLRGDPGGEWLESSVRHLVSQAGSQRPGHAVLLAKMAEALFIESLRRYMEQCRQNKQAGSRRRGTPWSEQHLPRCTGDHRITGPWKASPPSAQRHVRSSRNGSSGISASRR